MNSSDKLLLLGDQAIALGAIHAGISGVYAYPGTPSTCTAAGARTRRPLWKRLWVCRTWASGHWSV